MPAINWIQFSERMVGRSHPTLADTLNRALRELMTNSGYSPDSTTLDLRIIFDSIQLTDVRTPHRGISVTRYAAADADPNQGVTFRGRVAGGTPTGPLATPGPGNVVAFSGHTTTDGATFSGQGELVLATTEPHTPSARGTFWSFNTTLTGETTLATRWQIDGGGHLIPFLDNTYDIGFGGAVNKAVRNVRVISLIVGKASPSLPGLVQIDGAAGTVRDCIWTTDNVRRWHLRANSSAESGGNAGSDCVLRAYDDAGAPIDDPITIPRMAGGVIQIPRPMNTTATYRVSGTIVLGARRTGWATATGTATRTTFDTATVTLPQLAERMKALIDDLHGSAGHGLIGT